MCVCVGGGGGGGGSGVVLSTLGWVIVSCPRWGLLVRSDGFFSRCVDVSPLLLRVGVFCWVF